MAITVEFVNSNERRELEIGERVFAQAIGVDAASWEDIRQAHPGATKDVVGETNDLAEVGKVITVCIGEDTWVPARVVGDEDHDPDDFGDCLDCGKRTSLVRAKRAAWLCPECCAIDDEPAGDVE